MDLWPFDIRRFGKGHNVPLQLEELSIGSYGHYYQVSYPNNELASPRGQRRSALYDILNSRGAVNGSKFGWERANWFAPKGVDPVEIPTFGRSNAWPYIEAEHQAVRNGVGIIDQTSFSKYEISGPGALPLLQRVAGANLDVKLGKIVYTQLLNASGGIEADVTITRLTDEKFYFVTGSAFGRHDVTFILQNAPDDGSVTISDVTSAYGVINVCGPRSREVVQKISYADLSHEAFPYMTGQEIDLGHASVRALRATYVGELGWEFHVPTEYMRDLYERILEAGAEFDIRDVGYKAVNSLRLEKQFLAWAVDVKTDNNPYEADLAFAVRPDKQELLAGPALRKIRDEGVSEKLCWFSTEADVVMHGGELVAHPTAALASTVRSAGFGYTVRRNIFSAYVPIELSNDTDFIVEVAGERFPATRHDGPLYDAKGIRIRS
jgi:4-methylaminobutanoate oxidase (formaldehyde-forming)